MEQDNKVMMARLHTGTYLLLILIIGLLWGCNPHKELSVRPLKPVPGNFILQPTSKGRAAVIVPKDWWKIFGDKALDQLMQRAFSENLDLKEGVQRIREAEAIFREARSARFPSLEAQYQPSRSERPGFFGKKDIGTNSRATLMSGYEVDLWKKVKSGVDATSLELKATKEDLRTLGLSISSQIAVTYFRILGLGGQLRILNEKLNLVRRRLGFLRSRYLEGLSDSAAIYAEESRLRGLMARREDLLAELQREKNGLWILIGEYPKNEPLVDPKDDIRCPEVPSPGVPAALLERRPDVRAAYYRVAAQDKRVARAISDWFPGLRLDLQYGYSKSVSSFGIISGTFWNMALNSAFSIIDAGKRRAELKRQRAALMTALIEYQRSIFRAVHEVDDALFLNITADKRFKELSRQKDACLSSMNLSRKRYEKGLTDIINFLQEKSQFLDVSMDLVKAKTDVCLARIDLVKALGGSWSSMNGRKDE